jgi:hypothetical protein
MYHAFWLGMDATGGGLGELMLARFLAAPREREVEAAAGPRDRDREAAEPEPRLEGAVLVLVSGGAVWE